MEEKTCCQERVDRINSLLDILEKIERRIDLLEEILGYEEMTADEFRRKRSELSGLYKARHDTEKALKERYKIDVEYHGDIVVSSGVDL